MLELHFTALTWMRPIEIERERIEELELLVVLEQTLVPDPGRRPRVLGEFGLEPLLTINLAVEHSLRQRAVVRWGLVDQHHPRESVAPVVESPTMHARHQPAERVLSLVELGRTATRPRDVFCRGLDEVIWQAGDLIGHWIAVELGPTSVMVQNHMEHQLVRVRSLKFIVAKGASELMRQRCVLVHHDRQMRLTRRRRLNNHADILADRRRASAARLK